MTHRFWLSTMTGCMALAIGCGAPLCAQERFDSPDAAVQALIQATDSHDSARLTAIFGPEAQGILTSGNLTQDRNEQSEFARLARANHRLVTARIDPNRVILSIGDEDWPFPVPICRKNGKWSFDASQAPVEMQARRIGADELDAIEICHGYVDAQKQYASQDLDHDGVFAYAPHLMATAGHQDGLYWAGTNQPLVPEPMGRAATQPYHGYYFHVLTSQGPDAPGGAHNYVVNHKMIGGFALVAWPAEYGVTGVHTFIVSYDGTVYQKDIPPVRGKSGPPVTTFDPDHSWEPVE